MTNKYKNINRKNAVFLKNLFLGFVFFLITPLIGLAQSKPKTMYLGAGGDVPIETSAIIRNFSTEIDIKSKDRVVIKVKKAITILDDDGKGQSDLFWTYDSFSKILNGKIWVYDTEGNMIEKLYLQDMRDVGLSGYTAFFNDLRVKYYQALVKKTPYTIQFEFTKVLTGFFQLPTWVPQATTDTYVEQASLEIVNYSHLNYRYYLISFPDSSLSFTEQGNQKIWKVKGLIPIKTEGYSIERSDQLPDIRIQLESFEMDGYPGEFKDWASFGQWSYDLNKDKQELSLETKALIKQMTDTLETDREKAELIYNWVQDQTRYVSIQLGIGGWQSFSALDVDEKKYGDCKALSNYTMALYKSVGIESYYSLVNAGSSEHSIDPEELSNKFNHVILCLPFDGDTTWLECTSDDTPFGYISSFTDDRYALLIKDGGSKLVKTTRYTLNENLLQRISNIQITSGGGIKGNLKAEYHNLFVANRQFQMKEALPDQKDNLYSMVGLNGFQIQRLTYQFHEDIHPSIYEELDFTVRKIASTTSTRMFFPLFYLNKKKKKLKKDEDRVNDIIIKRSYTYIDTIHYQLPEGYQMKALPKEKSFISDFGTYQTKIHPTENGLIYVRKEEKFKGVFEASRFDEFRDYKNKIIKADKASLTLEKI